MVGRHTRDVQRADANGRPVGTSDLLNAPGDALFVDSRGHRTPERGANPVCNDRYGRWVPGGDTGVMVEEIADQFIAGHYDYDTAVRLTEALKDAVGKPSATKRDLLTVLMRKREVHHGRR